MNWYNAVRHDNHADTRAAVISGPYESTEAATEALRADRLTVEDSVREGARLSAFGSWVALRLASKPEPIVTLRDKLAGAPGSITVVRV